MGTFLTFTIIGVIAIAAWLLIDVEDLSKKVFDSGA